MAEIRVSVEAVPKGGFAGGKGGINVEGVGFGSIFLGSTSGGYFPTPYAVAPVLPLGPHAFFVCF